jgi:voltage-gated potassium channel
VIAQFGFFRELKIGIVAFVCLIVVGTVGYMVLEDWSFMDAFYMTIITVFTVGFHEMHELDVTGRLLTIFLIVFGVSIALWAATNALQFAVSAETRSMLRRRKMRSEIEGLRDHFIVCGYGRMGREVSACFRRRHVPHVVIDNDPQALYELVELRIPHVHADAADDEVLVVAGIERARAIIAVAGTDAENTFIVLSARSLSPDITIVARAATVEAAKKLRTAGADRVVSPYVIGGQRIAAAATQPNVVDFLDVAMRGDEMSLAMEEVVVEPGSELIGRTLATSQIRERSGAVVVAIKEVSARLNTNPPPSTVIDAGDILIAVGTVEQLTALAKLSAGNGR